MAKSKKETAQSEVKELKNTSFRGAKPVQERLMKPVKGIIYLTNTEDVYFRMEGMEKTESMKANYFFADKEFMFLMNTFQYERFNKNTNRSDMNSTEYMYKSNPLKIFRTEMMAGRPVSNLEWKGIKSDFAGKDGIKVRSCDEAKTSWGNHANIYAIMMDAKGVFASVQIKTTTSSKSTFMSAATGGAFLKSPFVVSVRKTTEDERENNQWGNAIAEFKAELSEGVDYSQMCDFGDEITSELKAYFEEKGLLNNKDSKPVPAKKEADQTAPDFTESEFKEGEKEAEQIEFDDLPSDFS